MRITKHIDTNKCIGICLVWAFVIPIIIIVFAYHKVGIYLGGPNTILTMDMGAQYMPFWASLRRIVCSDNSLFLNLSGALANNFGGFAYYIFSPLTWITEFFSLEKLPDVIYFLTLLRIGLCGISFCCYLLYTYREKQYKLAVVLLSCCYALMSYNVGYSLNLMWLDAVIMLPWILMGIERILRENKPALFIFSVFLSLVFNYYITGMSAVFAVGYLFIRLTEIKKWSIKQIGGFILYALMGIGLAMPILLPGVLALANGKLDEQAKPITDLFRYNIFQVVGQLLSGRYDTLMDDGLPLIFCGTGTVVLALIYLIKGKDSIRNRLLWTAFTVFYFFSMCFIPLDRIMHGFKETTCFEVRYSYVFSCLLLILAYRGIDCIYEKISKLSLVGFLKAIATLFVLIELYINSSVLIAGIMVELPYSPRLEYDMVLNSKKELIEGIEDTDFYRVSDYIPYTFNDGAWLGYNGIGYFSSCYNLKVMNFLGALGENQSYHILKDSRRTPLEESLIGAKYRITYLDWSDAGELIDTSGLYALTGNESALSLGYMIYSDTESTKYDTLGKNAFENQNMLASDLSGKDENVFVELEPKAFEETNSDDYEKITSFTIETECDSPVWIYFEKADDKISFNGNKDTKLVVDGRDKGMFIDPESDSTFMIYLGRYEANTKISIKTFSNIYYEAFHVAYMDEEVYQKVIYKLKQNQLILTEHENGHFLGNIDAGAGGGMLLSLPAIDGWIIRVDGERIEPGNYRNVMLTIPLTGGVHSVDIRFISPGVFVGLIIGVISLLMIIMALSKRKSEVI